mmetsp:Transcript_91433/g.295842  ORF Transcript_91433/g.295842 Transcript_91433/m.295842 type:complete len:345 (+) Transcript_91433:1538-2572(+)
MGHAHIVAAEDHDLALRQRNRHLVVLVCLLPWRQCQLAALVVHQVHDAQLLGLHEAHILVQLLRVVVAQRAPLQGLLVVVHVEAGPHQGRRPAPGRECLLGLPLGREGIEQGGHIRQRPVHSVQSAQAVHVHGRPHVLQVVRLHAQRPTVNAWSLVLQPSDLAFDRLLSQILLFNILLQGAPFQDLSASVHRLQHGIVALEELHDAEALIKDLLGDRGCKLVHLLGRDPGPWGARPGHIEASGSLCFGRHEFAQLVLGHVHQETSEGVDRILLLVLGPSDDTPFFTGNVHRFSIRVQGLDAWIRFYLLKHPDLHQLALQWLEAIALPRRHNHHGHGSAYGRRAL